MFIDDVSVRVMEKLAQIQKSAGIMDTVTDVAGKALSTAKAHPYATAAAVGVPAAALVAHHLISSGEQGKPEVADAMAQAATSADTEDTISRLLQRAQEGGSNLLNAAREGGNELLDWGRQHPLGAAGLGGLAGLAAYGAFGGDND